MMKTLNDIKDKNPFNVPDHYFEEVNRKILSATSGSPAIVRKKGFIRRLRPALAIAASAAVLIALSYTAVKVFSHGNQGRLTAEVTTEEFEAADLNDIDILTLEENTDPSAFINTEPVASKTEIIDYLLLENIDIDEIYELL